MSFVKIDYKRNILIDSDFEECLHQNYMYEDSAHGTINLVASATKQVIASYHSRGKDVTNNLFKLNWWMMSFLQIDFTTILTIQSQRIPHFTYNYYYKLKQLWDNKKCLL